MRDLAQIFKALSDETRIRILGLIFRHDHLCVCEVERLLGTTQSKASRHLRYLRDAGLLVDEREGAVVNYRIPPALDAERSAVLGLVRERVRQRGLPESKRLLVQIRAARGADDGETTGPAGPAGASGDRGAGAG